MTVNIVAIGGPTGVGKSSLAMRLAETHPIEIISADSVQVYRGFDIGSAKPTPAEQAAVRHHCVDICDPSERYDAARFARDADVAIAEAVQRDAVPVVVGGTGLYLRALLFGLFDVPSDPAKREALRAAWDGGEAQQLYERLQAVDPVAASRIAPADGVRIVRALEVFEVSGTPFSELQAAHQPAPRYRALQVTVSRRRSARDARIRARAKQMLDDGLLEETRQLRATHEGAWALGSLGYRQAGQALDDVFSVSELEDAIYIATRRFAKRQLTWFRGQWDAHWLDLDAPDALERARAAVTAWCDGVPVSGQFARDDAAFRSD